MLPKTQHIVLIILVFLGSTAIPAYGQEEGRLAPRLDNLGDFHRPITTADPMAQRYFDQGLILAYAFNHAEAERAFREAARRDPKCAMCYWGIALVLGPNINAAMEADAVSPAYEAMQHALDCAEHATEKEQAFIHALAQRYAPQPTDDRAALDAAFAEAMRDVLERYPDDDDAATLFAESLMDTTPWNYWTPDGKPRPGTQEVLTALERVMARNPKHPGANHLYIHAVEAAHPERGIAAADRLRDLVPGAGHLVHMPGHIYIRVGRYHDAVIANERAIAADQEYITQCHAQGLYPIGYMPHNRHFLWAAATMEGQSKRAIDAARHMAMHQDQSLMREPGFGTLQHYWITPVYALVRFGKWDEILADPKPAEDLLYPTGVWHYARGMAFLRKGRLEEANQALAQLAAVAADPALESVTIWEINTTASLLKIATDVLAGELAAAKGHVDEAVRHLEAAVAQQDALTYDEPPPFHYSVRQSLGAVLLEGGHPARAEQVYREDLTTYPENGWSLFGLRESLLAQGKTQQAEDVRQRFEQAWRYADVTLASSRF